MCEIEWDVRREGREWAEGEAEERYGNGAIKNLAVRLAKHSRLVA